MRGTGQMLRTLAVGLAVMLVLVSCSSDPSENASVTSEDGGARTIRAPGDDALEDDGQAPDTSADGEPRVETSEADDQTATANDDDDEEEASSEVDSESDETAETSSTIAIEVLDSGAESTTTSSVAPADVDDAETTTTTTATTEAPPLPETEEEIPVTAPVNEDGVEPGSGTPDFDDAIAAQSMDSPCDLFTEDELASLVQSSSNSVGLFADLPPGLGDGSDLTFAVSSSSQSSCEFFSDPYIWFVGITWEAADPTFVDTAFGNAPTFGTGYEGAVVDDKAAQVVAGDLYVRVSNLVPGNTSTTKDRTVTQAIAEAIGAKLS